MSATCRTLIDNYVAWLGENTQCVNQGDIFEITTPFLDRHNDHLQIYVEPVEQGYRLTDDGYILSDLELSGCGVDSPHRRDLLKYILSGFGVREESQALVSEATDANFPQRKHALVQAMLAVNDLFLTARPRIQAIFFEDVSSFLDAHEVRYSPNVEFTGKSGFIHRFDFIIPKSRKKPERIVRAINRATRDTVFPALFSWTDTKEARSKDSRLLVFLNDAEKTPSADVLAAFRQYDVDAILWSDREKHAAELAA